MKDSRMPETNNMDFDKGKSQRVFCPFIKDPHQECYCLDINSSKVNLVAKFCSGDYEECDIYNRILQKKV
jgi:hypothetical protein